MSQNDSDLNGVELGLRQFKIVFSLMTLRPTPVFFFSPKSAFRSHLQTWNLASWKRNLLILWSKDGEASPHSQRIPPNLRKGKFYGFNLKKGNHFALPRSFLRKTFWNVELCRWLLMGGFLQPLPLWFPNQLLNLQKKIWRNSKKSILLRRSLIISHSRMMLNQCGFLNMLSIKICVPFLKEQLLGRQVQELLTSWMQYKCITKLLPLKFLLLLKTTWPL